MSLCRPHQCLNCLDVRIRLNKGDVCRVPTRTQAMSDLLHSFISFPFRKLHNVHATLLVSTGNKSMQSVAAN